MPRNVQLGDGSVHATTETGAPLCGRSVVLWRPQATDAEVTCPECEAILGMHGQNGGGRDAE